jgi:hypothetical protein
MYVPTCRYMYYAHLSKAAMTLNNIYCYNIAYVYMTLLLYYRFRIFWSICFQCQRMTAGEWLPLPTRKTISHLGKVTPNQLVASHPQQLPPAFIPSAPASTKVYHFNAYDCDDHFPTNLLFDDHYPSLARIRLEGMRNYNLEWPYISSTEK